MHGCVVLSPRTVERSPTNVTSATLHSRENETTAEEPRKILPDGTLLVHRVMRSPCGFLSLLDGHVVSQTQLEGTPVRAKHPITDGTVIGGLQWPNVDVLVIK